MRCYSCNLRTDDQGEERKRWLKNTSLQIGEEFMLNCSLKSSINERIEARNALISKNVSFKKTKTVLECLEAAVKESKNILEEKKGILKEIVASNYIKGQRLHIAILNLRAERLKRMEWLSVHKCVLSEKIMLRKEIQGHREALVRTFANFFNISLHESKKMGPVLYIGVGESDLFEIPLKKSGQEKFDSHSLLLSYTFLTRILLLLAKYVGIPIDYEFSSGISHSGSCYCKVTYRKDGVTYSLYPGDKTAPKAIEALEEIAESLVDKFRRDFRGVIADLNHTYLMIHDNKMYS